MTLNVKKIDNYNEHIQHKTQKCKFINSIDQDELMDINSLYPED